jgi:hypothetical protein
MSWPLDESWRDWQALLLWESKLISISAGLAVATDFGGDVHRHRLQWIDIDAGGRPPRYDMDAATLRDIALAKLRSAPPGELRGKRGQPTVEACQLYLELRVSIGGQQIPRAIIRDAIALFLSP